MYLKITGLLTAAISFAGFAGAATDIVIPVSWTASPVMESCEGPSVGGNSWFDPLFRADDWKSQSLPDSNAIQGDKPSDKFYRGMFETSGTEHILLQWRSDDGSWIYLNGKLLAHEGGDCHQGGCVNMRCGNGVGPGGLLDLSPHIKAGTNLLAVHLSNGGCCGASFDARLLRGVGMVPVDWTASPVLNDCEGPEIAGRKWHENVYAADDWQPVKMPDINPIPWNKPGDRFYRGYFIPTTGRRHLLKWQSDDGSWVYINGRLFTHEGGACHAGGTGNGLLDITPRLTSEVNLVAIHLSNMPVCCGSLLSATVLAVDSPDENQADAVLKELF
ncbi:MAG: hypothetical protein K1X53_14165 [Candidatus Sumerlaeaceae bacterium]|nr:hypothetical protein [Candidatus Sumerlaeaceae bacterium]